MKQILKRTVVTTEGFDPISSMINHEKKEVLNEDMKLIVDNDLNVYTTDLFGHINLIKNQKTGEIHFEATKISMDDFKSKFPIEEVVSVVSNKLSTEWHGTTYVYEVKRPNIDKKNNIGYRFIKEGKVDNITTETIITVEYDNMYTEDCTVTTFLTKERLMPNGIRMKQYLVSRTVFVHKDDNNYKMLAEVLSASDVTILDEVGRVRYYHHTSYGESNKKQVWFTEERSIKECNDDYSKVTYNIKYDSNHEEDRRNWRGYEIVEWNNELGMISKSTETSWTVDNADKLITTTTTYSPIED